MSNQNIRSHAAHRQVDTGDSATCLLSGEPPSKRLHPTSDQVREVLEELDDVIFHAIAGDSHALAQAQILWPAIVADIGWELVEESREQYLRYAIEVTQRLETKSSRTPEQTIAALDVISLLAKSQPQD